MSDFNFATWLKKMTDWEDADTQLIFISTKDGGIEIADNEYNHLAVGKTLEEACWNFESASQPKVQDWHKDLLKEE